MARVPKYGVQLKSQWNCKICQSEKRIDIEDVLVIREHRNLMPDGSRPTMAWIINNSERLFGVQLNEDNVKSHLKRHFSFTGRGAVAEVRKSNDVELIRGGFDEAVTVAPDDFLTQVVAAGAQKVKVSPEAVTIDHALKAVAELTKRKTSDRDALLMGALVEALSKPKQAAPAGEVIDAEVVYEIDPPEVVDAEPG